MSERNTAPRLHHVDDVTYAPHNRESHGPCVCLPVANTLDSNEPCFYCKLAAECPICHPDNEQAAFTESLVAEVRELAERRSSLDRGLSNPKDLLGSKKAPLDLWPETATALGSLAMLDGALKYGRDNFRAVGVRASVYIAAARRHLAFFAEGETIDPESGIEHLGHALACIAIIIDARAAGVLNDDRKVRGGFRELMDALTPEVARLKALHADKNPRHFTIADNAALTAGEEF